MLQLNGCFERSTSKRGKRKQKSDTLTATQDPNGVIYFVAELEDPIILWLFEAHHNIIFKARYLLLCHLFLH